MCTYMMRPLEYARINVCIYVMRLLEYARITVCIYVMRLMEYARIIVIRRRDKTDVPHIFWTGSPAN